MPLLDNHQISIIARGPVAKGLLTEAMLTKASDAIRENGYLDYTYTELESLLPSIQEKLKDHSMNELAFQYILASSTVAAVIPGASSTNQLLENIKAVNSNPLSSRELELLRSLTKASQYEAHRD